MCSEDYCCINWHFHRLFISDHTIVRTRSASYVHFTGGVWLDEVEIESLGEEPASTPQSVSLETIVE
jgi:hypothetical protein